MTERKKKCLCFISSDTHWCRWRWWRWLSHTIFVTRSTNWPGNSKGYFFFFKYGYFQANFRFVKFPVKDRLFDVWYQFEYFFQTFLRSPSVKQNCIHRSEGQKACRPHKPCGALSLFRSAKTSWKKGFTNESKRKEPTCSYKDRATIRLLAPHSRACDRNHCLGKLCWLARRRWKATGAAGGTWLCFFRGGWVWCWGELGVF